jgi:hypothetical protein
MVLRSPLVSPGDDTSTNLERYAQVVRIHDHCKVVRVCFLWVQYPVQQCITRGPAGSNFWLAF